MKCSCGSSKLKAYNFINLDYIYYFNDEKWILSDPRLNYFFTTAKKFTIECLACNNTWQVNELLNQYSPLMNHEEIVLDLDQTLFYVETAWEEPDADFKYPNKPYSVFKRPNLDIFIKELLTKFKKINFFTAATEEYASPLIKSLNIPSSKLGYVKFRKDTFEARPLSFEREHMKSMENSLVIDDKHLVISGYNNIVIQIPQFHSALHKMDNELFKILLVLNRPQEKLIPPSTFSGNINIFLKFLDIEFKDLPWEKYMEILSVPHLSASEIDANPYARTQYFKPNFKFQENSGEFVFADVNYESYEKILNIISGFSNHVKLEKSFFDKIIENRHKKRSDNF